MENNGFTREYYVGMWVSILDSYQWWGHDLITLLDNIKKTNPVVSEVFDIMYKKIQVFLDNISKNFNYLSLIKVEKYVSELIDIQNKCLANPLKKCKSEKYNFIMF